MKTNYLASYFVIIFKQKQDHLLFKNEVILSTLVLIYLSLMFAQITEIVEYRRRLYIRIKFSEK